MGHGTQKHGQHASRQPQTNQPLFFISLLLMTMMLTVLPSTVRMGLASKEMADVKKLAAEYSKEEKSREVKELLALGDEMRELRRYDDALIAYEQVFLFDPMHVQASAKLDLLKEQIRKEGKDEIGIVSGVYEEEIANRVREYWEEVRTLLEQEKYGQARFTLEKLLLLDSINEEAIKLHEMLQKRFEGLNET